MPLTKDSFLKILELRLYETPLDTYNESTYEYSKGYRKCLIDLINRFLET
jgi:hypothetical protein